MVNFCFIAMSLKLLWGIPQDAPTLKTDLLIYSPETPVRDHDLRAG